MKMTWNQHFVKVSNKSLVLQIINNEAPLSRADISLRTQLNKGTVSSLVKELLDEHLCLEVGPGESNGGRRPVMLLFNQKAGFTIGIDLGVNYILGLLTDLQGEIIEEKITLLDQTDYSQVTKFIKEMISTLLSKTPKSHYGVVGIGIGVPGIVNNSGNILLAPNLGWKDISIKDEIENEFNIPVTIENEANAGAYGEKRFGVGQEHSDLIYVSAGIGIGVGIILNNELYRGTDGFSGEMGHMMIKENGIQCRCGSYGCWELYASEHAVIQKAEQLNIPLPVANEEKLSYLINLAMDKDERVLELFNDIGENLGFGISNIINTFNPQQIIIGNRLAMAKDFLQDSLHQVIKQRTLPYHQEHLKITFSNLSTYSAALGVSAFTIENFLKTDLPNY
ncbi:ROK family transcriptional regulator [Bacillus horti]|uniref:Glucokinase-like ROK family protein n=1 Tax=Caldalkalibacillus horti TaxID=77523 RepID=A0ABT9W3I4_9BACI|nr:ROK family transcriptional regulator [Bacillus horti]MDQ0167787.1 glucokinase-like ROK family protein [Bacillus horti]